MGNSKSTNMLLITASLRTSTKASMICTYAAFASLRLLVIDDVRRVEIAFAASLTCLESVQSEV